MQRAIYETFAFVFSVFQILLLPCTLKSLGRNTLPNLGDGRAVLEYIYLIGYSLSIIRFIT
jgi:hypothetical protein